MNYKNKIIIFLLFTFLTGVNYAQNWEPIWSEEFDGPVLDPNNWTKETGGGGWGNNELQYYSSREVNSFIEDGKLVIQAFRENYNGRNYTSARLKTENKQSFRYGKIEASIKLPYGQGIWPAFWMLGQSFSSIGWPACGEIDIMEMIGGLTGDNRIYGTAHWEDNGYASSGGNYTLNSGIFADDFHKFTIIWNSLEIKWYLDDNLYHTINITSPELNEFREEFFIILNVAVGGNWPGPPDPSTVFPQRMEVDYVRVYQILTGIDESSEPPRAFKLSQNYPNPFNPSTVIGFNLTEPSWIKLVVFNSLGEETEVLRRGYLEAGEYSSTFNAAELSSGVYFYRLEATGESTGRTGQKTRKMLLLR